MLAPTTPPPPRPPSLPPCLPSPQADAEEVCSILQQAFQLVYTEATMQQLNESITAGEGGMGQGSSLRREQKRSQKPSKGLLVTRETVSIATMKTEHAVLMNVGGHKISSLLVFLSPWRQGKTSN